MVKILCDEPSSDASAEVASRASPRPAGHCADDGAWAEFSRQYAGQDRSYGHLTDFALANAVFMADRGDLSLIHFQTAAKERIRWLSIRLAEALASKSEDGSSLQKGDA